MKQSKLVVMVVDDAAEWRLQLAKHLEAQYFVVAAANGTEALEYAKLKRPDLIFLDVTMPGLNGYEACTLLKKEAILQSVPVVFLLEAGELPDGTEGLARGGCDFIDKSSPASLLLARSEMYMALKLAQKELRERNLYLETQVEERVQGVGLLQDVSMMAMALLSESRDYETGAHLQRTSRYVRALAINLYAKAIFAKELTLDSICLLSKSALLHDIGKLTIPETVLGKRGKLTSAEFSLVKRHAQAGRKSIEEAGEFLGVPEPFLRFAKEMACYHHERWDGNGYPQGLAGERIPVSARLMALADVYDAIVSRRVYKEPALHEDAVRIIKAAAGTQFDPVIVEAFLETSDSFAAIAMQFPDVVLQ